MVYAFLAVLGMSILILSYYIDERKKARKYLADAEHMKKVLQEAQTKESELETKVLDSATIEEVLEKDGWEHRSDEDGQIWFKPDDVWYCISTDKLPILRISKGYNMSEDEVVNWDIVPQAGRAAEDKVIMSEFRYEEKQFYEFYLNSVEQVATNFEKALPTYLDILNATEHEFIEAYNELHDRMRLEEEKPKNKLERITESIVTEQIEKAGRNMNQNKVLS